MKEKIVKKSKKLLSILGSFFVIGLTGVFAGGGLWFGFYLASRLITMWV